MEATMIQYDKHRYTGDIEINIKSNKPCISLIFFASCYPSIRLPCKNVYQKIQVSQNLSLNEFELIRKELKGSGIRLSTLTKILYFFKITLKGYRCLILDSRIIEVFQNGKFQELDTLKKIAEFNKDKYYPDYLKLMAELAKANGYAVDQLELFLFMFGKSLKPIDFHKISSGIHIVNGGTSL